MSSGDLDGAEKFYRESLAMNRRLLGDKHPEIANGLENVAMSLQDKGDLAGAETLYRQSLEMRRELLGENHPIVGRTLMNLASLQYDRGETKEALANARSVLAIYRKAYPADNPEIARVLNVIGSWLTMAGKYDEADQYLEEGLAMRRRLFGARQPDVASSLIALAILQNAKGEVSRGAADGTKCKKHLHGSAFGGSLAHCPRRERRGGRAHGTWPLPGSGDTAHSRLRNLEQRRWLAADLSCPGAALLGHFAPARTARECGCRGTEEYSGRRCEAESGCPLTLLDIRRADIRPRSHGIPDNLC